MDAFARVPIKRPLLLVILYCNLSPFGCLRGQSSKPGFPFNGSKKREFDQAMMALATPAKNLELSSTPFELLASSFITPRAWFRTLLQPIFARKRSI